MCNYGCHSIWLIEPNMTHLQDLLKARNQAIQDMMDQAVIRAPPTVLPATSPILRVDLRESAIMGTAPEVIPEVVDEV